MNRSEKLEVPAFYRKYVDMVKEENVMEALQTSGSGFLSFLTAIDNQKWQYAYAPGKWKIWEVLAHINDTERIMAYRALRFARNDSTELPGFEQDIYIEAIQNKNISPEFLIKEFNVVRTSTLMLFDQFDSNDLKKKGTASNTLLSVEALGMIIAGHMLHHQQVLKERYL